MEKERYVEDYEEEKMGLKDERCEPCRTEGPTLAEEEQQQLLKELGSEWSIIEAHHLKKNYSFNDFVSALAFTNKVGAIAEEVGHHPTIFLTWGTVDLEIWTHKRDGLTRADFILAAKCDDLF